MNLDKSNWVTSMLDMVLNGITKEKNFPSRWVTFPPSSPESKLQGPFVRSPLYKTGEVPTKPCDLCALSSQCDLVAGGPQLQDRRTGCGKSKKAHWREGLSHPVCIWPGMDGWPPVPFQAAVSHCQGREKPGFPTLSLFFLSLGGFPEELTSSQIFLSPASPSCTVVSPSSCPLRYLVSLGSWSMRSFSLSLSPVSVCSFIHSS